MTMLGYVYTLCLSVPLWASLGVVGLGSRTGITSRSSSKFVTT